MNTQLSGRANSLNPSYINNSSSLLHFIGHSGIWQRPEKYGWKNKEKHAIYEGKTNPEWWITDPRFLSERAQNSAWYYKSRVRL